jgi:hypothetical protein
MPPPLDELMRGAGVMGGGTTLLREFLGWTGIGFEAMIDAKEHARRTAAYTGSDETFGPDRVVFLSDPGGTVLWVETGERDSAVWGLTEGSPKVELAYARLACFLETEVVKAELGWPDREHRTPPTRVEGGRPFTRDENFLRAEIQWLVERTRVALQLPGSAVVGCSDEQIAEILDAQAIRAMPPPLDELLRVGGVSAHGTVLRELLPSTGVGWDAMLAAKDAARRAATATGRDLAFGADQVVLLADPDGTVLWVELGAPDPPVWALTTQELWPPYPAYGRLACFLEEEVLKAEAGHDRQHWLVRGI